VVGLEFEGGELAFEIGFSGFFVDEENSNLKNSAKCFKGSLKNSNAFSIM
jgi:hypothetical protein